MKIELNYQDVMKILLENFMLKGHDVLDITVKYSSSMSPIFTVYSLGVVNKPYKTLSPKLWENIQVHLEEYKKLKKMNNY